MADLLLMGDGLRKLPIGHQICHSSRPWRNIEIVIEHETQQYRQHAIDETERMEYSDFHLRTIIKVGARFGFSNFDVHPDEITNAIGVEPDGTSIRGENRLLPKGKTLVIPSSCWWVESKSDSKDINAHLRQIFNRLDGVEASLNPSYGEPWMTVKYKSNYLYMGSGPILEAEVLEKMAKLRVELAFDIYQVDQELSEEELEDDIQRITKQEMMGGSSDSESVKL